MKAGLVLIGDELLNGSRQDKHMATVIGFLKQRGMKLAWVRIVADEEEMLVNTFRDTFQCKEIVFSFGGIGATPDDLTRACVAKAANVKLARHPEAVALIENKFKDDAYPNRILMSELPVGSSIIPNTINQVPGFKFKDHHFVPGFPNMSWPMVEWVLDTYYSEHFNQTPDIDKRWYIRNVPESELLATMHELLEKHPGVQLSSLPSTEKRGLIDFGLKGQQTPVEKAAQWFENYLQSENIDYELHQENELIQSQ